MSYLLQPETATGIGDGLWSDVQIRDTDSISIDVAITGAPSAVTISIYRRIEKGPKAILISHGFSAAELSAGVAAIGIGGFMADQLMYSVDVLTAGTAPTVKFHTRA